MKLINHTLLILLTISGIVGCGMSEKEKDDIANVTCSIMVESRNMDAALRVKEINNARSKLGEEPYLGGDKGIIEAFEYGLCPELVKNDKDYNKNLYSLQVAKLKRLEQELIEAERRAEERRAAEVKRLENERIKAEKLAKIRRIAKEKNLEEKRIAARILAEEEGLALEAFRGTRIHNVSFDLNYTDAPVNIRYDCADLKNKPHLINLKLNGVEKELKASNKYGYCSSAVNNANFWLHFGDNNQLTDFLSETVGSREKGSLFEFIEYIDFYLDTKKIREYEKN